MNKIFLYLYPIEDYTKIFLTDDDYYKDKGRDHPLDVLNQCIEKRYREKGYQVVLLTYPDRKIYGINTKDDDKIIYTDITFQENRSIDEDGKRKSNFIFKYPNEDLVLSQLDNISELVVGGYHYSDCVKRMAERALDLGIKTTIDLDMTDLFFGLYFKQEYFKIDEYDPNRYKEFWIKRESRYGEDSEYFENCFMKMYDSPAFGFAEKETKKR